MIIEKLKLVEFATESNIRREHAKLEAVKSLREMLGQIDFTAEDVPLEDEKRLTRLLSSLKGDRLSEQEIMVASEIVCSTVNRSSA